MVDGLGDWIDERDELRAEVARLRDKIAKIGTAVAGDYCQSKIIAILAGEEE